MSDQFHEITRPDDPLLGSFWFPLYRRAFPPDERVAEGDHVEAAANGAQHLLVGMDGSEPVSMARYDVIQRADGGSFGYLMYMAVDESAVSRGHGQQMFAEILARLAADHAAPRLLVFEVQRPENSVGAEPHQSADRRIAFYRQLGAYTLDGVDYVQRIPHQPPVPMLLMARPMTDDVTPSEAVDAAMHLFGNEVRAVASPTQEPETSWS
jgi:GNAT superfamily N-acetyltransferase